MTSASLSPKISETVKTGPQASHLRVLSPEEGPEIGTDTHTAAPSKSEEVGAAPSARAPPAEGQQAPGKEAGIAGKQETF